MTHICNRQICNRCRTPIEHTNQVAVQERKGYIYIPPITTVPIKKWPGRKVREQNRKFCNRLIIAHQTSTPIRSCGVRTREKIAFPENWPIRKLWGAGHKKKLKKKGKVFSRAFATKHANRHFFPHNFFFSTNQERKNTAGTRKKILKKLRVLFLLSCYTQHAKKKAHESKYSRRHYTTQ